MHWQFLNLLYMNNGVYLPRAICIFRKIFKLWARERIKRIKKKRSGKNWTLPPLEKSYLQQIRLTTPSLHRSFIRVRITRAKPYHSWCFTGLPISSYRPPLSARSSESFLFLYSFVGFILSEHETIFIFVCSICRRKLLQY